MNNNSGDDKQSLYFDINGWQARELAIAVLDYIRNYELAKEQDETVSDLVREIVETAVTQDSDNVSGIRTDLMERIRAEAQRRNISTGQLITILLRMASELCALDFHPRIARGNVLLSRFADPGIAGRGVRSNSKKVAIFSQEAHSRLAS